MRKEEIQAEHKRLRKVKKKADAGQVRAESFGKSSQTPMFRNYLTGVGPLVKPIIKRLSLIHI